MLTEQSKMIMIIGYQSSISSIEPKKCIQDVMCHVIGSNIFWLCIIYKNEHKNIYIRLKNKCVQNENADAVAMLPQRYLLATKMQQCHRYIVIHVFGDCFLCIFMLYNEKKSYKNRMTSYTK